MLTFLLFIFITVINCESRISIHKDCREFRLTVQPKGEFEYTSEDLEIMDEFKKYFYFLPECHFYKGYQKIEFGCSILPQDKVKFYPQESPYYLTIEYMSYWNEQRWLPGFRFDFDETECPSSKFNSNLTKAGYISLKRGDTACIYDFWIKKFDNFVNVSINGYETNMMDLEEFKNITFVFLRNGTYKVEYKDDKDWTSPKLINVRNITKLHDKRNCKLIQPRKNNETKIAFIVHSLYKSCDLRLIMDNGDVGYIAKLPLKFSPVEQQSPPRVWDTSEAELPPSPDAEGVKYKYDGDFDVFILLIIWTILLASMLLYEILYRIFNKGQGIYPLSFAMNKSFDKHGSAEGGSNSASVLPPISSAQSSAEQQQQPLPYDQIEATECPSSEDPKLEELNPRPDWKKIGVEFGEIRENDSKLCLPLPGKIHDEKLKLLRAHYATQVVPGILETGHIDGGIYYREGENPKFIYDGEEYDTKEDAQLAVHYDRQFVIKEWYEQTHENDMAYFWGNETAMKWDPFTSDILWEKEEQNYYEFKADLEFMKNVREGKFSHLGMNEFIKERLQN